MGVTPALPTPACLGLRAPDSLSSEWILEVAPKGSSIVDVGAGRSMLLPTLLSKGYTDLTHVDWSESASLSLQRSIGHRGPEN